MKAIVINASPKRKGVNAQLAKSAAEGAKSVGADVEYVDLYKYELHGCMSCLICKQGGNHCKCYWKDELSSLIERILDADVLIIVAQIFFSEPTSHFRALIERLFFCLVSYDVGNAFKGKIDVGIFYTISYHKDYFEKTVRPHFEQSEMLFSMLNGEVVFDSFMNISEHIKEHLSEDEVNSLKDNQLAMDLDKAFERGANLCR